MGDQVSKSNGKWRITGKICDYHNLGEESYQVMWRGRNGALTWERPDDLELVKAVSV